MGQCKQCHYYERCLNLTYPYYDDIDDVTVNNIEERRKVDSTRVDCFKSPQQYNRDIETAKKSQAKQKEMKQT